MEQLLSEGSDYVARARSLGPVLVAAADEIERSRELPASIVSRLIDNGFFRLLQPHSLDGAELDPMTYIRVVEEIASHDASTGWCVEQANGCSMVAAFLAPEVAQEIFGPPDGIVAWGPVGPAELTAVPGGYRLTGAWNFASGSHHATWLGAHVVTHSADGTPLSRADGGEILQTLLFPKSRPTMTDIWHVVGLRGTGSDRYSVTDLFIPERYTVLRDPKIAPHQSGRLYCFSSSLYACGVAAVALGIARGMVADFTELATEKTPRGLRQRLCENQMIQMQRAQAEAQLGSARAYLLGGLTEIWETVGETGELSLEQNATIRLASTWAIDQAREVVNTLYHSAGATAIFDNRPFERRFRDMHTASQQAQGRQAHYETIGRVLFGLTPDTPMFVF
ncbi:MAG: acyl-CoA dehydrogenase family protein [Alphaproteobacteria bacterium]|nr:acyl-CoA dehydrogenase family protein [Alphaproteobacteria bacterium]